MTRKDMDYYGEITEQNSLLFIMMLFRIQEYLDTWKTCSDDLCNISFHPLDVHSPTGMNTMLWFVVLLTKPIFKEKRIFKNDC